MRTLQIRPGNVRPRNVCRRTAAVAAVLVTAAIATHAQDQAGTRLTFEAASIKPNRSGSMRVNLVDEGDHFIAINVSLFDLVRTSFGLEPGQLSGGPSWVNSERFDVNARAPRAATRPEFLAMVRALLADRFQLRVRTEWREQPVFDLALDRADGRLGTGLRPSALTCSDGVPPCMLSNLPGRITARGIPIETLRRLLINWVDDHREVIDRTGLTGKFDVDLQWTTNREYRVPDGIAAPPIDPDGPPLVTAVREQLGLKLVPGKSSTQVVVIESAERPTAD
jgi:uncharacterized protein (TIGR03435 family)